MLQVTRRGMMFEVGKPFLTGADALKQRSDRYETAE
jgi:hypothetical protein